MRIYIKKKIDHISSPCRGIPWFSQRRFPRFFAAVELPLPPDEAHPCRWEKKRVLNAVILIANWPNQLKGRQISVVLNAFYMLLLCNPLVPSAMCLWKALMSFDFICGTPAPITCKKRIENNIDRGVNVDASQDQSINQSTNRTFNQSINRTFNQSINRTNMTSNQLANQSINRSKETINSWCKNCYVHKMSYNTSSQTKPRSQARTYETHNPFLQNTDQRTPTLTRFRSKLLFRRNRIDPHSAINGFGWNSWSPVSAGARIIL